MVEGRPSRQADEYSEQAVDDITLFFVVSCFWY
jgi:hypothetical protein